MALAIAHGLNRGYSIEVVGRSMARLEKFEKELGTEVQKHLIDGFDMSSKRIILCVKPANIVEVGAKLRGTADVVYSVLAGTTLESLQQHINAKAHVRTMPNVAATVRRSMTTLTGDVSYRKEAESLFDAIGHTLWVNSEKEMDIATALAGSGPAYLALVSEALADGAVKQGLKRDHAMKLMRGLFEGFGTLIQHEHPALLKDRVMSPGGTTAAGYSALEDAGVRKGCIDAIEKAYAKAKKLGQ